jgi:hypothetical protein
MEPLLNTRPNLSTKYSKANADLVRAEDSVIAKSRMHRRLPDFETLGASQEKEHGVG